MRPITGIDDRHGYARAGGLVPCCRHADARSVFKIAPLFAIARIVRCEERFHHAIRFGILNRRVLCLNLAGDGVHLGDRHPAVKLDYVRTGADGVQCLHRQSELPANALQHRRPFVGNRRRNDRSAFLLAPRIFIFNDQAVGLVKIG